MKKKAYMKPLTEAIEVKANSLMEVWSIGIDNNPDHGIGAGDEDDIGAKQGFFFDNEEEIGSQSKGLWDY